jgi:hypothetical protein
MKSIAGTEVLWKTRKAFWGGIEDVRSDFPTALEDGDYFVLNGIVAGDNREKGLSIVDIDTGKELTCVLPGVSDYQWEKAIKIAESGVWDCEKAAFAIEDKYNPFGGPPKCPYK